MKTNEQGEKEIRGALLVTISSTVCHQEGPGLAGGGAGAHASSRIEPLPDLDRVTRRVSSQGLKRLLCIEDPMIAG